ncbi:response regulator [Desulfosarcina sp.]|uniref:response regulator n=1 Tax=Desulfosarcina sp. TaxID=2027861 RepID=UPI003970D5E1
MTPKAKILIVDDEVILVSSVERELARRGYQLCESACSGEDALEKLKAELPDLVLLDCFLGCENSGFDVANRIRSMSDIPIVFMSGLGRDEVADQLNAIAGSAFLAKPFNPEALVRAIELSLQTCRGGSS